MNRPRPSLFGPVALIAVGVLLLIRNLVSGYAFWTPILDHWPWFLVAWGGIHVIQHLVARAAGSAGPRRLGAGAVILALLLCIAGQTARSIRANDGVVFRGFGHRIQVTDPAFRSRPPAVYPERPDPNESP